MRPQLLAGIVLVTALAIFATTGYVMHVRNQRDDALAKLVLRDAELEGAHRALEVKPKEVVKFVEVPAAVAAGVKTGTITPVAAAKGTAKSNVVNVPCPEPTPPTDLSVTNGMPPKVDEVPERLEPVAPVWFDLSGELFIGSIKKGAPIWSGKLGGNVHSGEFEAPITFDPGNVDLTVKVSEEIGKAVDAYNRPWWRKHVGIACPGVGVAVNPFDGGTTAAVTCGVSVVWHPW